MDDVVKHIFVTGGVVSSLGKGLTASSLGRLLKARGLKVTMQKFDPYINVDPGTMNPFQHGEVFVTEDGAETDLDIGHYERFLDVNLPKYANTTTGQIYSDVINKERRGKYLGDTVQVIPHITNQIKYRMRQQEISVDDNETPNVIITEVGGTVGDIESQPFLEAARQVRRDIGSKNVFFAHVSLVPYIGPSKELKTKPTQHSVAALRSIGIQPNALILRSDRPINDAIKEKIGLMCDVETDGIINCPDASSIYDIPVILNNEKFDEYIIDYLGLQKKSSEVNLSNWRELLDSVHNSTNEVEVALVGKYIDLPDAYLSITEALRAGGFDNFARVKIRWVVSDSCQTLADAQTALEGVHAVLVPGGFGVRGIEGKIGALQWSRENKVPTLGICLGLQSMVIEFARNVLKLEDASSTEFDQTSKHPIITTMQQQVDIVEGGDYMGGTMRLGSYDAKLKANSIVRRLYGLDWISERHRHRYEVNNKYVKMLEEDGMIISGTSLGRSKSVEDAGRSSQKDNQNAVGLVEFVELEEKLHPYYVATQAHPEFKSRPTNAHPLFSGLIEEAIKYKFKEQVNNG